MEMEFIKYDCNFNKVFIIIQESEYCKGLINCYAYRKIKKYKLFTFKKYIQDEDSDLYDKRCNAYINLSEINKDNYDEKINYLIDSVMKQVNNILVKEKNKKESYNLLFSTENG